MPATFRDVLDLFDAQKGTNGYQSLPEFAQSLNNLTGTNNFDAGLKDSWIKRASIGLDKGIEWTELPDVASKAFGEVGDWFGMRDTGEEVGRKFPRGAVNFLPLAIATALSGGAAALPSAGLLGAGATASSAALSGADTYTETGSAAAGLASAVALPLAGGAAKIGGQLVLKAVGAPLLKGVAKTAGQITAEGLLPSFTPAIQEGLSQAGGRVAETLGQRAASYFGGQAAALGVFEAAGEVGSLAQGQGIYNPLEPERLFATLIGQLPFAALDIPRVAKATPSVDQMKRFMTTEAKFTQEVPKSGLEGVPVKTELTQTEDALSVLAKIKESLAKSKQVQDDVTKTPEEKQASLNLLEKELGVVNEDTTQVAGLGYGKWLEDIGNQQKAVREVRKPDVLSTDEVAQLKISGLPDEEINNIRKQREADAVINEVEQLDTPSQLADLVKQVDSLAKAAVDVGASEITNESLKRNLDRVSEVAQDQDAAVQQAVQVEKNKVINAAGLARGTAASVFAKAQKSAANMTEFTNREELSRTKHPEAQKYKEDIDVINKFLTNNDEVLGEGREKRNENLSKGLINTYINWDAQGRVGGYPVLEGKLGKTRVRLMRPAVEGRPTLKTTGVVSADLGLFTKKFNSAAEADQYLTENKLNLSAQRRTNKDKTRSWYVLEDTKRAAKLTSLETEQGGQKREVTRARALDEDEVGDNLNITKEDIEDFNSGFETDKSIDEVAPVVESLKNSAGAVETPTHEFLWDQAIASVKAMDDEAIHAEFMHKFLDDVEETPTNELAQVRDRSAAVLELQRDKGLKAPEDVENLGKVNSTLLPQDKFKDHQELIDFTKDKGFRRIVVEATKTWVDSHPLPSSRGVEQAKSLLSIGDGRYKGFRDLTEEQKSIVALYQLEGASALQPIEAVASADGLYGIVAKSLLAFQDRLNKVGLVNLRLENGQMYDHAEFNPAHNEILYGKRILPEQSATYDDHQQIQHVIVHETLHSLTHELIRNSPIERANLDGLRLKAIEGLPKDIKAVYLRSQKENRYQQYQFDRGVKLYDLSPEQYKWHGVLYALENVDEFISQSFSSDQTQNYLRTVESAKKGNVFSSFVNYVKSWFNLGDVEPTLLNDVIAATDRLLNPELRKPFEREDIIPGLVGKFGLTPKEINERTGTVIKVLDALGQAPNKIKQINTYRDGIASTVTKAFLNAHKTNQLNPEDVKKLNAAQARFDNYSQGDQEITASLFAVKGQEDPKSLGDLLRNGLKLVGDPKTRKEFIECLDCVDQPIVDALSTLRRYATTTISAAHETVNASGFGLVNSFVDSPGIKATTAIFEGLQSLNKMEKVLQKNAQEFAQIQRVTPLGLRVAQEEALQGRQVFPANPNENIKAIQEELGIIKPNFFTKNFAPLAQLGEQYPVIRDALNLVFRHQGDVREKGRLALLPFAGTLDKNGQPVLSKKQFQRAYEVKDSPVMNKAVGDVLRLMNEDKVSFDSSQPKFESLLNKLGTEQRAKVVDFVNQTTKSMRITQDTILKDQSELGNLGVAQLIQTRHPEFRSQQSESIAKSLQQSLQMLEDPTQAAQGQALLQGVQTRLSPETFQETLQFAVSEQQRVTDLAKFYAARPWFSSEQRFRRFLLRMVDNEGETYTADYHNANQAEEARIRLEGKGYKYADLIDRKDKLNHPSFSSDAMIDKVAEINKTRIEQLRQKLNPDDFERIKNVLNIDEDLERAQLGKQLIAKGTDRRLANGREELDMIANHVTYVNRVINGQSSKITRARMELALMDPEVKKQPELARLPREALENYMRPDTKLGGLLTKANFFYFMGMNPSTSLLELGQAAFSLIPTLVNEGQKLPQAYKGVLRTANNIKNWALKGGTAGDWENPEHAEVMNRAGERGEIGLAGLGELMDDSTQASVLLSQLGSGEQPQGIRQLVKKPLAMYQNVAATFYGYFTHFNSRMALLSAFDHFRSKGQSFEDAFTNAERINNVANFAGGRAARPVGFYGAEGEIGRTGSMALGSLQSYTLGMVSMMGRYFAKGFGSASKDLRPADRANARKAAVIMFGTQLAAAGALGLPGIGAGIALLEQFFPDLELNKAIRENLAKLGGDDKALGSFISDTALRGVVNQIGGVDIGSRLSLGNNVMGLSSYDGFDPVNVLGPSVNLFKNMAVGASQLAQGNFGQAAETLLPPAYKKVIQLSRGGGDIVDSSGKLVLQPSMGEKFALLLGFQPKSLSDVKDAKRIESRSLEIEKRQTIQFNSQLADALQAKDQVGLRALLQSRLKQDDTFDPRSAIRQAASLVEQRTLPLDLARTSTSNTANRLLETYQGLPTSGPSEVQRLQLRKQIELTSGIPGLGQLSPTEIRQAQLIDQLMAQGMTREEARNQINRQLHPRSDYLYFSGMQ